MQNDREKQQNKDDSTQSLTGSIESKRTLPCRGCLASCINFDRCEGRPWTLQ